MPAIYKAVETIKHEDVKRKKIPSAEQQPPVQEEIEMTKTLCSPTSLSQSRYLHSISTHENSVF